MTDDLPEPYEGINGTVRAGDDLLSLEEEAMPRRRTMIMMGMTMRSATLVGNAAPNVGRLRERMMNPEPGDLVIETSSARRKDSEHHGIGILLARRRERDEADVFYVQYGPGERDIARWANSEFAALPVDRPWPLPAEAERITA